MNSTEGPPKIFVSYRWSSPSHEEWVLRLATSLRASGIDVQLDKWHLKEGQDTLAFMESMVNDPSVEKVLLVCDSGYVERANSREGGVGTEAQIISQKVYSDTDQNKFAAIVVELDDLGKPLIPTYMATRLYFDMSNLDAESLNFEKIVRWVFNQPFHAAPPIGTKPDFLAKTYKTGSPLFRIGNSIETAGSRTRALDGADAILNSISEEVQTLHAKFHNVSDAADQIYKSIKEVRPVSENAYSAIRHVVNESPVRAADLIHSFFETLFKSWDQSPENGPYTDWDNDVYRYFVHDLFVSFVAICMEQRNFEFAADILSMPFFKPRYSTSTGEAVDYTKFRPYLGSLENLGRTRRRTSLHADLLYEGHEHSIVSQISFLEADFTLYLRELIVPSLSWYPISALYLADSYGALPTYVRGKSARFYDRLKPLLFNIEPDTLRKLVTEISGKDEILKFSYSRLNVGRLMAVSELATSA